MQSERLLRNVLRSSVVFAGWMFILLVILGLELMNVAAHAGALWSGLEALGTDQTPLSRIPLIGPVLAIFGVDVTLSEVMGIAFAAAELALAFFVAELMVRLVKLPIAAIRGRYVHHVGWLELDWGAVLLDLLFIVILGAILTVLIVFDRQLYVYRTNADALEAAVSAWTGAGPDWLKTLGQKTAATAADAYTAVFLGGAVALAMLIHRVDDAFERTSESWWQLLHRVFYGAPAPAQHLMTEAPQQMLYGYDAEGQPVLDAGHPIAYHPDGTPVAAASDPFHGVASAQGHDAASPQHDPSPGQAAPVTEPAAAVHSGAHAEPATHQPVRFAAPHQPETHPPAPQPPVDELVPVITTTGVRSIQRSEVLANPTRYHLDLTTGQWWERCVWEELDAAPDEPPRREAA